MFDTHATQRQLRCALPTPPLDERLRLVNNFTICPFWQENSVDFTPTFRQRFAAGPLGVAADRFALQRPSQ